MSKEKVCAQCDGVRWLPVKEGKVRVCEACNPKGKPCAWSYTNQADPAALCIQCNHPYTAHASVKLGKKPAEKLSLGLEGVEAPKTPAAPLEVTKPKESPTTKVEMVPAVGRKDDGGKLRYDLIPTEVEQALAEVFTYGAQKYGPDNWKLVPDAEARYFAAIRRHLAARRSGELRDPESGKLHTAMAMASACFLVWFDLEAEETKLDLGEP